MSIKRKGSGLSFAGKRAMTGRLYILPWFIGFICFFLIPFIEGVVYTVNKLSFGESGVNLSFVGTANYKKLFSDLDFLKVLSSSLAGMFPRVLIIVFFSLFVALILRGEYKGRALARAIFFLPVIISSGVVITVLQENIMGSGISGNETTYLFKATSFETLLEGIGLPDKLMKSFTEIINQLFDLSWKSGVQILLLLAAVNNIPRSSYEAADMEGATEWEKFWKITFPTVSPTILVTVIYTVIDSFTDYSNSVMRLIEEQLNLGYYEYSSTMALVYFVCVLVIIGIVGGLISRKVYYQVD